MEYVGIRVIERSQPKGVKPKMTGRILRSCVYSQGVLKEKRRKSSGV
jgi:hypothetical protein